MPNRSSTTPTWPSDWTTPKNLADKVRKLWDTGKLGRALLEEHETPLPESEPIFPLRLPIKGPPSSEWTQHFLELKKWIEALKAGDPKSKDNPYQLEWRDVQHRDLGKNSIPVAAIIPNTSTALSLAGLLKEGQQLLSLYQFIVARYPGLAPWCKSNPHAVLEHRDDWPPLLACLEWFEEHPQGGVYSRQIDAPGVHGKFVENNRSLLGTLLELVLPTASLSADENSTRVRDFNRRYGLLDKPVMVRMRFLDPNLAPDLGIGTPQPCLVQELSLNARDFKDSWGQVCLGRGIRKVLVLENEVTYLSLPSIPHTLAILGSGYGFAHLAQASWLTHVHLWYWGDLDTHGFAILSQIRGLFPHCQSILMDLATLVAHQKLWTSEPQPHPGSLLHLSTLEQETFQSLGNLSQDFPIRLEQERLNWHWILEALSTLKS